MVAILKENEQFQFELDEEMVYPTEMPELTSGEFAFAGKHYFINTNEFNPYYTKVYCSCGAISNKVEASTWSKEISDLARQIKNLRALDDCPEAFQEVIELDREMNKLIERETHWHSVIRHKSYCSIKDNRMRLINISNEKAKRVVPTQVQMILDNAGELGVRVRRYDFRIEWHHGVFQSFIYPRGQFFINTSGIHGFILGSMRLGKVSFKTTEPSVDNILKLLDSLRGRIGVDWEVNFDESVNELDVWKRTGLREVYENRGNSRYSNNSSSLMEAVRYLDYYLKYPAAEQLAKSGYMSYLFDSISRDKPIENNVKEEIALPPYIAKQAKWFGLTLIQELRVIHQKGGGISEDFMHYLSVNNGMMKSSLHSIAELVEEFGYKANEIYSYLERTWASQAIEGRRTIQLLIDSIRMAKDMNVQIEEFPRSLVRTHDVLTRDYKYVKNEALNKKYVEKHRDKLNVQYAFQDKNFFVRSPESLEEIAVEGAELQHCVASYADRVANGVKVVLFIRRKDEPEKPYVTVELVNGRLAQCRGIKNKSYSRMNDKDLVKFVKDWCKAKEIEN